MTERLSSFLNASRWMAAFLVLVGHVRHLVLTDFRFAVTKLGVMAKALYFATDFGYEAVMVFFVVSGYLVGGLAVTRYSQRGFPVMDYAIHRVSRLYTVLIPALFLGGVLDIMGLSFFNGSNIYTNSIEYHTSSLNFAIANNLNFQTLVGNLAMMEGTLTQHFGSNGPLWSLAFEWWYYCIFAAVMILPKKGSWYPKVVAGIALFLMLFLLPHHMILWFTMWLVGVGAAVYGASRLWKPPVWLGFLIFGAALAASRIDHSLAASAVPLGFVVFARDLSVAIGYAFLMLSFHKDGKPILFPRVHHYLAGFSYTLYLVHFPMLVFIVAAFHEMFGVGFFRQPDWAAYSYMALTVVVLVLYSWVVYLFAERNTNRVREFLSQTYSRFARDPAVSMR